ncbi:hypothetical protein pthi1_p22 [Paracoccus phage vB_PthS_Pthi1]|nr:hypothetical protein pthi1_p22 [Paracoccus phage vB_PthS_Pthi1]
MYPRAYSSRGQGKRHLRKGWILKPIKPVRPKNKVQAIENKQTTEWVMRPFSSPFPLLLSPSNPSPKSGKQDIAECQKETTR